MEWDEFKKRMRAANKCTFCDEQAIGALGGVRRCLVHEKEYQHIGRAWNGQGTPATQQQIDLHNIKDVVW